MSEEKQGVAQRVIDKSQTIERGLREQRERHQWIRDFWNKTADRHHERREGMRELHAELSAEARRVLAELTEDIEGRGQYEQGLIDGSVALCGRLGLDIEKEDES